MSTENFSKNDWILVGLAALLVIDLLFLPWFSITVGPITLTGTATADPDAWLGVLAVLSAMLLITDLSLERMSPDTWMPSVRGSRTETRFLLACLTAVFLALKFVFNRSLELDHPGSGFFGGIVLAAALVLVAMRARDRRHTRV